MQLRKYAQKICWQLTLVLCCIAPRVLAQTNLPVVEYVTQIPGESMQVGATTMVENALFFNTSSAANIDQPYPVKNIVTLGINENYSKVKKPFTATIGVEITYTDAALVQSTYTHNFVLVYDSSSVHKSQDIWAFENAHRVTLRVTSVSVLDNAGADMAPANYPYFFLENKMQVQPKYKFSCTTAVSGLAASDSGFVHPDELTVVWSELTGAHEYDLEWAYIDSNAYVNLYHNTITAAAFENNASRVSIKGSKYAIPLMYNDAGFLCFRVRPVQYKDAQRLEGMWSSISSQSGIYAFRGHERALNWQSTVSYAEDGKRKVVVQYFDGSLRSRQTVTKDNTSNKTIVAESLYDYQGRPVLQVLPVPTLNSIIGYTKNFNVGLNGSEYDKGLYDTLPDPTAYCSVSAGAMGTTSGASQYYSAANPDKTGFNAFIPDAENYPFTETQYAQDGTGRISKQSGVGAGYKLGSGHETKYYYATPSQEELDALFGTEVGDHSHYFKNAVMDANGQLSVSYMDMKGHTIATALAGDATSGMDALNSNNSREETEVLADAGSAIIRDRMIEHKKSLFVDNDGVFIFRYKLDPETLKKEACTAGDSICYSCLYDLKITITDDCNNQHLPEHKAYEKVFHNFSLDSVGEYGCNTRGFDTSFVLFLSRGSYDITKQLRISKYATDYFRDSVFLPNNTCTTLEQFIRDQRDTVLAKHSECVPSCEACRAEVGLWPAFKARFIAQTGIADSVQAQVAYQQALDGCASLCDTHTELDALRNAMLADVTPPSGQYATLTDVTSPYSIFYQPGRDQPARNRNDNIVYKDEIGHPDSAFDGRIATLVIPNRLDSLQFANLFKSSWAEALLPLHPEYCRLQVLQGFKSSYDWDTRLEKIETFQQALDSGYLNPLGKTSTDPGSPYYRFPGVSSTKDPLAAVMGTQLQQKMDNYMQVAFSQGASLQLFNIWSAATITGRLGTDTTGLYDASTRPFNTSEMCTPDLDMAWLSFRNLYLQLKKDLIYQYVMTECPGTPADIIAAGFNAHFMDAATALSTSGLGNTIPANPDINTMKASTEAAMLAQYDANCRAYAYLWMQQLAPCAELPFKYDSVALSVIIPKLISVCKEGSDATHPGGSSSVKPSSSYAYRSFEEVIREYNQQHGLTANLTCNPELITGLKPYDRPVSFNDVPVLSAPDSCQCSTIKSFYAQFQENSKGNSTFSAYLKNVWKTNISDLDISMLMNACDSTNRSCKLLAQPIMLPPALQCGMQNICATCIEIDTFYNRFVRTYPAINPSVEDTSEVQQAQNQLFAAYMNNRLGFAKQAWEYLQFRDSCRAFGDLYGVKPSCATAIKEYDPNGGANALVDVQPTSDDGYIAAGWVKDLSDDESAGYVVKTDNAGNIQWVRKYPGLRFTTFSKIRVTNDGYIAMGTTDADNNNNGTNGHGRICVIKMNNQGDVVWSHIAHTATASGEVGRDLITLSTGGYAVCGSYNYAPALADLVVFTLDNGGHLNWAKQLGRPYASSDDGGLLLEDQDTLVFAASVVNGVNYYGAAIVKLDKRNGTLLRDTVYKFDEINSMWGGLEKVGDEYQLTCRSIAGWGAPGDYSLGNIIRINKTGAVTYQKRIKPFFTDLQHSGITSMPFRMMPDGGFVTASIIGQEHNNDNKDAYLSSFSADGTLLTTNRIRTNSNLTLFTLQPRTNGGIAAVGTTNDFHAIFMVTNADKKVGCYDSLVNLPQDIPSIVANAINADFTIGNPTVNWDTLIMHATPTSLNVIKYACNINVDSAICPSIYIGPVLCGSTAPVFNPDVTFRQVDNCMDTGFFIQSKAIELYNTYRDSVKGDFESSYVNKCLDAYKYEIFTVTRNTKEYHYTLYYYDQAGNLTKTVPPAGVQERRDANWFVQVKEKRALNELWTPEHTLVTYYAYNTLNQVVEQRTPDAGISHFWYDRLGRLAVSQNAKQANHQQYSYTRYDYLGRITEVGQLTSNTAMTDLTCRNDVSLQNWLTGVTNTREQITMTVYDLPYSFADRAINQRNLRNRVSYAVLYDQAADIANADNKFATGTFYSYDIHGNVDTLLQFYKKGIMSEVGGNRYKKMVYQYDLVSGKVNYVAYQPGREHTDAFYHKYYYDAENRLTSVETSKDSVYWENEALYSYYKHGPLARVELGKLKVQGLDYIYTLQGWIKAVNPTTFSTGGSTGNGGDCAPNTAVNDLVVNLRPVNGPSLYTARNTITFEVGFDSNGEETDTKIDNTLSVCNSSANQIAGSDGLSSGTSAADAFSYVLHYNNTDYKGIKAFTPDILVASQLGNEYRPLYNGNISGMGVAIAKLAQPQWYNYKYDQLNRLVQMDAWKGESNSWSGLTRMDNYHEGITYDGNGNILSYQRNGNKLEQASVPMDILTYHYKTGTNQLDYIDDAVPETRYSGDIDVQSPNNYTYDEIGNLTSDAKESLGSIEWNVYGKIKHITKNGNTDIDYTYDVAGNRISKSTNGVTTWYVRDAQGNVMSTYESGNAAVNSGRLSQIEIPLYGSSRIGILRTEVDVAGDAAGDIVMPGGQEGRNYIFTRGKKLFELSNHLGNVLATVSDRRVPIDENLDGTIDYYVADVVSANDYYPFGMLQPGRSYNAGGYRYGFNGQERSSEINDNGFTAEYWEYDARIGRRWNVDPVRRSWESPYAVMHNNPIYLADFNGADANGRAQEYAKKHGLKDYDVHNSKKGGVNLSWTSEDGVNHVVAFRPSAYDKFKGYVNVADRKLGSFMTNEVAPRVAGGLKTVAGVGMMGVGFVTAELGVGIPVLVVGADVTASGVQETWYGRSASTFTEKVLRDVGQSEAEAALLVNLSTIYFAPTTNNSAKLNSAKVDALAMNKIIVADESAIEKALAKEQQGWNKTQSIYEDCSELAEKLYEVANKSGSSGDPGQMYKITPKVGRYMSGIEYGDMVTKDWTYHQFFVRKNLVYDPMFSAAPVPWDVFMAQYQMWNPEGLILTPVRALP